VHLKVHAPTEVASENDGVQLNKFLITGSAKLLIQVRTGPRMKRATPLLRMGEGRESAPFLDARRSRKGFNEQLRERKRAPARRGGWSRAPGIIPRGAAPRPRNYWS